MSTDNRNKSGMYGTQEFESSSEESSGSDDESPFAPSSSRQSDPRKRKASQDVEEQPDAKRASLGESSGACFSEKAKRMMQKMNYDTDKGLGKRGQGRVDIVPISTQKGRRGLGLKLDQLDAAAAGWDQSAEVLNIPEKVDWFEFANNDLESLTRDDLEKWIKRGAPKMTIHDENQFCEDSILQRVLQSKTAFDKLGAQDMLRARTRCNPFETIKANIFMNRAAVKMANMDAMFDYMFTNPVDEAGNPMVKDNELLYFADVCAGPGGFSEYVLWRKKWHAKGFGFTLKGNNDFKLHDFVAGAPESFDAYYGPKENGDVFDPENIQAFTDYVLAQAEAGVHLMMADGGFSVEGKENEQEILSKQLYLCQILVALNIVRAGGHFVVKLFDLFTPFSVGLIYLVAKCFKKISICKPNTSRPANSERYLVCKWKHPGTGAIQRHLFEVNEFLFKQNTLSTSERKDILELVPYSVLRDDEEFYGYVCDSNNEIGRNQINGLLKIAAFAEDSTLVEAKQGEIRSKCLNLWNLPDEIRKLPSKIRPEQYGNQLLGEWEDQKIFMKAAGKQLNDVRGEDLFATIHGWHFVPVATVEDADKYLRTFFMSRGGRDVFQYDTKNSSWMPLRDSNLELPPRTLVYGEIVKELQGQGRSQTSLNAFHIIDGIVLGGVDIRKMPLLTRLQMCEKFAKAVDRPFQGTPNATRTMSVRSKRSFVFYSMDKFFDRMEHYKLKDGIRRLGYKLHNASEPERFYVPRGLLFLNEVRDDYLKMYSRSQDKFYFFCKARKTSIFLDQMQCIEQTVASFKNSFVNRVLWTWFDARQLITYDESADVKRDPKLVYRADVEQFLLKKTV